MRKRNYPTRRRSSRAMTPESSTAWLRQTVSPGRSRLAILTAAAVCGITALGAAQGKGDDHGVRAVPGLREEPARLARVSGDLAAPLGAVLQFDAEAREHLRGLRRPTVEQFPLTADLEVDLELERFWVTNAATRFVAGTPHGDVPLPAPDVALYKGRVAGQMDSQVFLAVGSEGSNGFVYFSGEEYVISRLDPQRDGVPAGSHLVYRRADTDPFSVPVDFRCDALTVPGESPPQADGSPLQGFSVTTLRQADVALECDYEFRNMFGTTQAASNYVAALVGAVSSIYEADTNMRLNASYVRIWETTADPYSATNLSSALGEFQMYWNANMTSVPRNTAHLLSGKGLGGGIAYINQMCGGNYAYGVSSSLDGTFPTPIHDADSRNWDLIVVAHELGHNFRSPHTHCYSPPVDTCYSGGGGNCWNGARVCQQGTIMSYCHLCGGLDNIHLTFGPIVSNYIETGLQSCIGVVSTSSLVYVDWQNTGQETGSASSPYNTVTEGVNNVAPGGTVHVAPGIYDEGMTINQPVTITADGGVVSIG